MNSVEIKDKINELKLEARGLINKALEEKRDMNEDENSRIEEIRNLIKEQENSLTELENRLKEQQKNNNIESMEKRRFLIEAIKEAQQNIQGGAHINGADETRTIQVNGAEGTHDETVEIQVKGIFAPLFEKSVINDLGATWYKGAPMGDIKVSKLSLTGDDGWEEENGEAHTTGATFEGITLRPKRFAFKVDISNMWIAQDTLGAEQMIRDAIAKKAEMILERGIFANTAATATKPAGILYNKTLEEVANYKELCDLEAELEEDSVYGEKKYCLAPKAKSALRAMIKGNNNSGFVLTSGEVDGTTAVDTNLLKEKNFILGDWSKLAIALWNDVRILVDPYTQSTKDITRIVVNGFCDFAIVDDNSFKFGKIVEE